MTPLSLAMKNFPCVILALLSTLLFASPIYAANNCVPDDINLTTQAEVDDFQTMHGDGGTCDTVTGNLHINNFGYYDGTEVIDLTPLKDLTRVGGSLAIESTELKTLDGLSALESVGDSLGISVNDNLYSVNALSALTSVGTSVDITFNYSLAYCSGLQTLLDAVDDAEPGPGPGEAGIPDVGTTLTILRGEPSCSSLEAILDGDPSSDYNPIGLNGLFYDPANSGHGFDFNMHDAGFIVYYYGHTINGERLWLISEVFLEKIELGAPFKLKMFEIPDGLFGAPVFDTSSLWGEITITMVDCDSGSANFDGQDGVLEMSFVRLSGLAGINCGSAAMN